MFGCFTRFKNQTFLPVFAAKPWWAAVDYESPSAAPITNILVVFGNSFSSDTSSEVSLFPFSGHHVSSWRLLQEWKLYRRGRNKSVRM